jgi:hypothetical protein
MKQTLKQLHLCQEAFGPLDFASVLVESALETLVADDTVADVDGSAGVDAPGSEDAAGL